MGIKINIDRDLLRRNFTCDAHVQNVRSASRLVTPSISSIYINFLHIMKVLVSEHFLYKINNLLNNITPSHDLNFIRGNYHVKS